VRLLGVQEHPAPQDATDAELLRAMRVFRGLAFGVVLAVDGGPFPGHHAGREPQPETEKVALRWMKLERAMSLAAVKKYRHRSDGDVRQCERRERVTPPRKIENAGKQLCIHH